MVDANRGPVVRQYLSVSVVKVGDFEVASCREQRILAGTLDDWMEEGAHDRGEAIRRLALDPREQGDTRCGSLFSPALSSVLPCVAVVETAHPAI